MLVSIGRKPRAEGDLVDLLAECHGRIRNFSGMAVTLVERADLPREEIVEACAAIERYFREALPLHVRDEEESLLPRLRARSPTVDAALAQMEEQHELHTALVERLCEAVSALRVSPEDAGARSRLASVAEPFATVMQAHLEAEEAVIFPAVRELLSAEERDAVRAEMRARRER